MRCFKFKKAYAVTLALAMILSPLNIQGKTAYAAPKAIKSVSIKIGSQNVAKKTFKMTKGNSKKIKVQVKPASSKKSVTFKSGNKKVVQVSKKGKLTAKKVGTAKITVKVKGKNGKSKSTWVKIKVSKKKAVKSDEQEDNSTPMPASSVEPEASSIPEISAVPETSSMPEVSAVPGTSAVPEASATPEVSATPELSATPKVTITPGSSTGGTTSGTVSGGSSSGGGSTSEPATGEIEVQDSETLLRELTKDSSLPSKIIYTSDKEESITLPDTVKADNTSLVVNAPNATITNNAVFKDIQIIAISPHTWFEKAIGNKFSVDASNSHISVAAGASVGRLDVVGNAKEISIDNDGIIKDMSVSVKAKVIITGSNHTKIPFKATESAEGAVINTTIPLGVDTAADITLQIRFGAQMTSVSVLDNTIKLILQGIGIIPVTDQKDGKTENIVAGAPDGFDVEDGTVSPAAITGTVNQVTEGGSIAALANAKVYVLPYRDEPADDIIANVENDTTCKSATTSEDGKYEIKDLKRGNYYLVVKADGLQGYIQTIVLNKEAYQNADITMVEDSEEVGSIQGTLIDAVSGNVKSGLLLELRKGAGNTYGDIIHTVTSDADTSMYKFEDLPIGTYTIYVKDPNKVYSNGEFTVTILPGVTVTQDLTISKVDTENEGQLQFVLRWRAEAEDGSVSSDLDAHLVGPGVGGQSDFHTYYSNREYSVDGEHYADLDRDDTLYEGPETTTVRKEADGLYHFYVFDYANDVYNNTKLTTSRPIVDVYVGDRLMDSYAVPEGIGNVWDVCVYDTVTDTLTPINKIYYFWYGSLGDLYSAKYAVKDYVDQIKNMGGVKDNADVTALLAKAQDIFDTSEDFTEAAEMYSRLYSITKSVEISWASFSGSCYCNPYITRDGVPIIELKGREDTLPADLEIGLLNEGATYTITASDKEGYSKAVVVKNELLNITKTYYVVYTKRIPEMEPIGVKDGNNYIYSWGTDWDNDYVYIYGAANTLSNPEFEFQNEDVTYTYQPVTDSEDYIAGKLTVSYQGNIKVYSVQYWSYFRVYLEDISEDGNVFDYNIRCDYKYDNGDDEYGVFYVSGLNEKLGNGTAEGVNFKFNIEPTDVKVTPAEAGNDTWDFVLSVTFMGKVKKLYVKYTSQNINLSPENAYYTDENGNECYIGISTDSSAKQITINDSSFNNWETLKFNTYYSARGISYEVITEADGSHSLLIKGGNKIIDTYSIINP